MVGSDSYFFIQPTTENEVEKYIKTLKNYKTNGSSISPNRLFKQFKKCLKISLAKLSNFTFQLRKYPEILKTGKVVHTHKKGSEVDCYNYRPISLTSDLNKILEKIMYDRIYSFLEKI